MRLTRRDLILGATALPALAAPKKQAARPSILLIVVEDLGAWMLGCYGNTEIRTPAIDLLARTGTQFTYSYSAAPTPLAGRAALLAGRAPQQLGFGAADAAPASLDTAPLVTDVLSGAGYRCAFAGAWGLAGQSKHGCSAWDVSEESAATTASATGFLDSRKPGEPSLLVVSYTLRGTAPAKVLDSYASTPFVAQRWEPVAANAAANADALRDIVGSIRKSAAVLTALDDQIGSLIRTLDAKGLRDETLVVLTASNGALLGRHGLWGDGRASNPPNMYEEVVNVPLIWQWHGHTPPEAARPELVAGYDFVPAICELVGAAPPADRALPGRSYLAAVLNRPFPKKQPWRGLVFAQSGDIVMAHDKRYKLVERPGGDQNCELYDVINDRGEKANRCSNPQFLTIRDELRQSIATWKKSL